MENEKFFNYYVEILTSTLQEAIGKNLVFQAHSKINEEELVKLKELLENGKKEVENIDQHSSEKIASLTSTIESLNFGLEQKIKEYQNLSNDYNQKNVELEDLRNQLAQKDNDISNLRNQVDVNNSEVSNLKNQLAQKDNDISNLKNQVDVNNSEVSNLKNELEQKIKENKEIQEQYNQKETEVEKLTKKLKQPELKIEPKIVEPAKQTKTKNPFKLFPEKTSTTDKQNEVKEQQTIKGKPKIGNLFDDF